MQESVLKRHNFYFVGERSAVGVALFTVSLLLSKIASVCGHFTCCPYFHAKYGQPLQSASDQFHLITVSNHLPHSWERCILGLADD